MRWLAFLVMSLLGACASTRSAPFPEAQEIVDRVAARHSDLVRLTLHAVPANKTQCTQVASTMAARRGKPSDPEDLQALRTGEVIVLDEPNAVDVTVPILAERGAPTAVAGVTLRAAAGADHAALAQRAHAIADELAAEVRAAGMPVW